MTTFAEFSIVAVLVIQSIMAFANILDGVILWSDTSFTFLDLLISIAFIEMTWDFILALAYGDYKREY